MTRVSRSGIEELKTRSSGSSSVYSGGPTGGIVRTSIVTVQYEDQKELKQEEAARPASEGVDSGRWSTRSARSPYDLEPGMRLATIPDSKEFV